jgi:hypothetical protein
MHRFSFWPVREHSPHTVWTGYPQQGDLFPPEQVPTEWRDAECSDDGGPLQEMAACNR